MVSDRSKRAVTGSSGYHHVGAFSASARLTRSPAWFITTSKSGLRPASWPAPSCSKGTSWSASAASQASRVRVTMSRKVGACPDRSTRSATVLTKKPTRSRRSGCGRSEMTAPMTMSSWPLTAPSAVTSAAVITIAGVARARQAIAVIAEVASSESSTTTARPAVSCAADRGRSSGSSSRSLPRSASVPRSSRGRRAPLSRKRRCQRA
ncbi:hypothetical protein ADK38_02400 [Streptomyces varsoviensis]|uniref:Uncharacterized protein n=1 Tax=Streptomyces varsoviensis TaxID=67373 RepID=A0ABR5JDQ0_9ACTN|nr:hypothetical protein ADK38_02400 [Streptomyces varsoviensis]